MRYSYYSHIIASLLTLETSIITFLLTFLLYPHSRLVSIHFGFLNFLAMFTIIYIEKYIIFPIEKLIHEIRLVDLKRPTL